ncbi:hypothetical protein [Nocardia fluminea]|uniref:hypothetical protein n=1 Tax=Nocardia fluminea TaxID=134984 RepID=UPI003D0ABCF5
MTAASAARAYERMLGVRDMDRRATDQIPSAQQIGDPVTTTPPRPTPSNPAPGTTTPGTTTMPPPNVVPAPPSAQASADEEAKQAKIAAEQKKRAEIEARKNQEPADQQPSSVPPPTGNTATTPSTTQQQPAPTATAPAPEEPRDPLLDANGPNQDPLPMPVTEGREQGKPWTEVRPNGQTVEYSIPEGNGKNTVDAIVRDSTGQVVSTARIVSIEGTAKYIRWQDDVGAGSSYYESGGPNELGYGQHFAPGTSTSGIPSQVFETSPDLSKTRTLSLDSDGRVVGVDVGVRNAQGLYDNIHVDNFGNATLSSTRLSPSGQLESTFTGQMFTNRSGWMVDEQGNHWEGEPDKDGNQSWLRVKNGHTYRMNHLGVVTDFSLGKDGRPRLDTIFPDGSQTTQSGRTTVHFDANGNEAWRKEIAAPLQPWDTRAWNATKRGLSSFGSLISDTVGAPFHMAQDGVRGMSSIRVDQYGTFHVTYDAPNRFANAGTTMVGFAKGAVMFYLALPKYGVMQGYDALGGSDFVRGSTSYRPPDREDELVKDLTGIPLKQWKEDTVASAFEFGSATAASLLLLRVAGVGRRGGTRPKSGQLFEHGRPVLNSSPKPTSFQFGRLANGAVEFTLRIASYGRGKADQFVKWGHKSVKESDSRAQSAGQRLEVTSDIHLRSEVVEPTPSSALAKEPTPVRGRPQLPAEAREAGLGFGGSPRSNVFQRLVTAYRSSTRDVNEFRDDGGGKYLYHAEADPLRRHGPAIETHPEEVKLMIKEAEDLGVEISYARGMAYGPHPGPEWGVPGRIVMDREASYGAWLHEIQHMRDSAADGWPPARVPYQDKGYRMRLETQAYAKEIAYALSIGDKYSAVLLYRRLKKEKKQLLERKRNQDQ